jgi:hypothetical protein
MVRSGPPSLGLSAFEDGDVDRQRVSRVQNKVWVKNACGDLQFRTAAKRADQKLASHLIGVSNQHSN